MAPEHVTASLAAVKRFVNETGIVQFIGCK
jgi:hypothetical protein